MKINANETRGRLAVPAGVSADDIALSVAVAEAEAKWTDEARSDLWWDEEWREATAREITEQVWWGFEHQNFLPLLADVATAEHGDRITIEEVYGAEVFWVAMGGQIDETTMTQDVFELRPDWVGFHVSQLDDEMRRNFGPNVRRLVENCVQQVDAAISHRLFRTYQTAIPGPGHDSFVTNPGLDLTQLNNAIDEVEDESITGEVSVVARRSMTAQLMDLVQASNLFTPETNEQILRQGVLGTYRGVPVISLRNFRDRHKRSFFPRNEMLVVARDAAKVGLWGGLQTREGTEQFGFRWHYLGRRSAGFAVWRPEAARRIVDSNLDA